MDKLCYYTKHYGTLIYYEKKSLFYSEILETFIYYRKYYGTIPKSIFETTMTMEFGFTMIKTMVLNLKLWNFDLLWNILWSYVEN